MYDDIDAGEIDAIVIADIAPDHFKLRMRLQEVAEPHGVESNDLPALCQELRNKSCAFITAGAGDQDFHVTAFNCFKCSDQAAAKSGRSVSVGVRAITSNASWRT